MTSVAFDAYDFHADRSFTLSRYTMRGSVEAGWRVERDGELALELGPGYRALRVQRCGVCSTDLARHLLPFALPQVIGHEVVAADEHGGRFVVEINASHLARGVEADCAFCAAGLASHCPERATLGIDTLPGGFGPWILAPQRACLAVPDSLPDETAVLVEPFAAALHAVTTVAPRPGERICVLGPRRLGMLVIAALAAKRDGFTVHAALRDPGLGQLARELGADDVHIVDDNATDGLEQAFDVVVDTTGNPAGLAHAVRLARREVHLKSTHGQPSAGLRHLTELVVDELGIARFDEALVPERSRVAWLCAAEPPSALQARCEVLREPAGGGRTALATRLWRSPDVLPRTDVAVVDCADALAAAIRPVDGDERSLVAPRGRLLLHPTAAVSGSSVLEAVQSRGLVLSSSRCGDFGAALRLLDRPRFRDLGARFVTHRFAAAELPRAFEVAGSRGCIKAVVEHRW